MSQERISVEAFEAGALDIGVCWLSGKQADSARRYSANNPVGAQWLLLLLGLVHFIVVRAITRKTAVGSVSLLASAVLAHGKRRAQSAVSVFAVIWIPTSIAASVGINVAGDSTENNMGGALTGLAALAFLGIGIAALIASNMMKPSPRLRLESSGRWILVDAHGDFVAAIMSNKTAG